MTVATGTGWRHYPYLNKSHPLAQVAAAHCKAHLGPNRHLGIGQVACGACWERAIRDDERFAVESGLPREVVPDASFVDVVAVERACAGERVRLTESELVAVVERLRAAGYGPKAIAARLGRSRQKVESIFRALAASEAAEVAAVRGEAA